MRSIPQRGTVFIFLQLLVLLLVIMAARSVLVSYLERNKKIDIPANGEDTDLCYLYRICRTSFAISSNLDVTLQKYDCDWGCYVDLDLDYLAEHKDKLKLVTSALTNSDAESSLKVPTFVRELGTPTNSSVPTPTDSLASDSDDSLTTPKTKKRRVLLNIEDDDTDLGSSSMCSSPVSDSSVRSMVKPKRLVSRGSEKPLPDPFPMPINFRADVDVALKTGKMTRETSKSFLSSIAGSMLAIKRYPTKEEFTRVAIDIVRKYPFMKAKIGSPTVSMCACMCGTVQVCDYVC